MTGQHLGAIAPCLEKVCADHPATVGERLFFTDPSEGLSTGWYRVTDAPTPEELIDEDVEVTSQAEMNAFYSEAVISLVGEHGSSLEAFPFELSRSSTP